MKPDVTINGVSMLSLGWLRETVNFPTPQSQSNTITVPGRNSPIRFTEALGRVAYQPRSFDMTFSMLGERAVYDLLVGLVVNQFAGQLCRVTLTEDPTLYALGTLEADPTYDPLTGKGLLVLSCTQYIQNVTLLRQQSADVVFNSYQGLRVPKDAVRVEDGGQTGVYVLEGATARWKPITILHDNGESYVVELDKTSTANLWPGDEVIIHAKNLYDGKVVGK